MPRAVSAVSCLSSCPERERDQICKIFLLSRPRYARCFPSGEICGSFLAGPANKTWRGISGGGPASRGAQPVIRRVNAIGKKTILFIQWFLLFWSPNLSERRALRQPPIFLGFGFVVGCQRSIEIRSEHVRQFKDSPRYRFHRPA